MNHYPLFQKGAYVSPPERGYSGNGATGWSTGAVGTRQVSGASATGIRVKIADQFNKPPQPDFSQYRFQEIRMVGFTFDFTFEQEFLKKKKTQDETKRSQNGGAIPLDAKVVDPWEQRIAQFVRMGYDRSAVSMALIAHRSSSDEQVREFLEAYGQLMTMGFDPMLVTAALMHHRGDIHAATETLLAAADS